MTFRFLLTVFIVTTLAWGSDNFITVEGYGEGFLFSKPHEGSEAVANMMVEPAFHLTNQVKLHVGIGFAHPSEEGGVFESELEVLSLDTAFNEDTDLSLGKVHMPVGLYNLYHEPIYFLTIEPSRVEHLIVPAEWHETAALVTRRWGDYALTVGAMSGMDATKLHRGSWIREGKESHLSGGGKAGWVARLDYGKIETMLIGGSIVTTPLSGSNGEATLFEAHATARLDNGWEGMGIISRGWISDIESVRSAAGSLIAKNAQGGSLTIGYDIGHDFGLSKRNVLLFVHTEYAQPAQPLAPENLGGSAWATGMNWYFSPHLVAKAEYRDSNHEGQRLGIGIGFVY